MMKTETAGDEGHPLDLDATVRLLDRPAWRALRDAHLGVLQASFASSSRAPSHADTMDDDSDAKVAKALAMLPPEAAEEPASHHLHALGFDLGRHVASKRVVGDAVAEAVAGASAELEALVLASLVVASEFLRTTEVYLEPRAAGSDVAPGILDAYAGGVIHGTVATARNARVDLRRPAPHRFEVRLMAGRDVNLEGTFDG